VELDAATAPELEGGVDVFGDEGDLGAAADEFVIFGAAFGGDEGENGAAVGRSDGDPASAKLELGVGDDGEAELADVEVEAAIVIADEDGGLEDAEIGVGAVRWGRGWVDEGLGRRTVRGEEGGFGVHDGLLCWWAAALAGSRGRLGLRGFAYLRILSKYWWMFLVDGSGRG